MLMITGTPFGCYSFILQNLLKKERIKNDLFFSLLLDSGASKK